MNTLIFNHDNRTLEIIAKIMNSYAAKYGCAVKYNEEYNSLDFRGEDSYKRTIAHETSYVLNGMQ